MWKDWLLKGSALAALIMAGLLWATSARLDTVEDELAAKEELVEQQLKTIEGQNEISQFSNRINRRLDQLEQTIEDAPNAQTPVSPDVANAWGNAIDGLRDDAGVSPVDSGPKDMPRSNTSSSSNRRTN